MRITKIEVQGGVTLLWTMRTQPNTFFDCWSGELHFGKASINKGIQYRLAILGDATAIEASC